MVKVGCFEYLLLWGIVSELYVEELMFEAHCLRSRHFAVFRLRSRPIRMLLHAEHVWCQPLMTMSLMM